MNEHDPDEHWDSRTDSNYYAVDQCGAILAGSERSHSSPAKWSRRRMSLSSNLANTNRAASMDRNAVDRYGYETAKSMRRRMSLGTCTTKRVDNDHLSPTPAKPWSSSKVGEADKYGHATYEEQQREQEQQRRRGVTTPRTHRNIRRLSLANLPSMQSSGPAADGMRSTVHGDSTSSLNRQETSNRSFAGSAISIKKKTKGFGKNLLLKLRSTDNPDVSSPGTVSHECNDQSHHSPSSGNTDYEYDDERSFFSASSSMTKNMTEESIRSCDPEMLSPRSAKRGGRKKVSSRSFRSADDNGSVGSNKRSKSREKPRRMNKLVNTAGEVVDYELSEVKPKRRGRNMYKIQSGPPDDISRETEEQATDHLPRSQDWQGGSNHSRSSRSGSIGKKSFKRTEKGSQHSVPPRSGSVGKKSAKKMEKGSQHSVSSRSVVSVGKKSAKKMEKGSQHSVSSRSGSVGKKSVKKMERRASIKAMKKMDCMLGQLEKYEDNLETEQIALRKQLEAMALEKEYTEQRNRELELQLEEMKEKAETDAGLLVNAESTKNQSTEDFNQSQIEIDILKRRLQRHELSLLKTHQQTKHSMRNLMENSGEESLEDSKEEVTQKDEEIVRLKADLCLLRDKLRDKTEDYDKQCTELEQAKDELAMLKFNMEHTGSFRYHNMHQIIREKERLKMQPEEVALSNFFDAY